MKRRRPRQVLASPLALGRCTQADRKRQWTDALQDATARSAASGSQCTASKVWRHLMSARTATCDSVSITAAFCQEREASRIRTRELHMGQTELSGPRACETMRIRSFKLIFFVGGSSVGARPIEQHQMRHCIGVELHLAFSSHEFQVQIRKGAECIRLLSSSDGITRILRV